NQDPFDNPFLAAKLQEAGAPDAPELDAAQQQALDTAQSAAQQQAELVAQEQSIIALQQQGHVLTAEQYATLAANYTAQAQALAQQGNALAYLGQLSDEETAALQTQQSQLMANAQAATTAAQQVQAQQAQ